MKNEELKKKIVEIIINAIWKDAEADYDSTDETEAGSIADALIAAGIGDVSEYKEKLKIHRVFVRKDGGDIKVLYGNNEVDEIVKERNEYKHRAEVAEKAGRIIQRDMARVFDISNPRVCELIANIWDLAKKQAEKELAEEAK